MNTEDSEFERIEREQAMRNVPDAIHHTDTSESLEYIQGWNDCRQAMLAEKPAPATYTCGACGVSMRMEQPAPAAQQELWGWAILHSDGTDAYIRPRLTNFFGQLQEREPFGNGDLEQCDIESAGKVPHRMVELYIREKNK